MGIGGVRSETFHLGLSHHRTGTWGSGVWEPHWSPTFSGLLAASAGNPVKRFGVRVAPFTGLSGEAIVRLHSPNFGAADVNGPAHQLTR